jgi:light-regulated signal transduction histidine kinase (bacteriophytochrome)
VQAFLELSKANAQLQQQADELAVMLAEREANAALLAKQAEELQRSNAELDHLATIASHDLAEPLRVIAGYSELLNERCAEWDDDDVRQITAAIERGVGRMQRLIDGMLIYARAGTTVPKEEVGVGEVVSEVLLALEALISDRDADIEVGALPVVTYNRTQLSQILQNLISNAVKFVPPGRRPTVRIWAERGDETWTVWITDNGMGVTPEERESIFDMFAGRAPDPTGSGIGLAICARIAERNGGTMDVTPGPEGGSAFSFVIPDVAGSPAAGALPGRVRKRTTQA